MDAITEHVVVIAHHGATLRVDDFTLVAFNIENDPSSRKLLNGLLGWRSVAVLALVMGDGDEGAAEGISVGNSGCRRMNFSLSRGLCLIRAVGRIRIPSGKRRRIGGVGTQVMPRG